jgi:hypothetical protein
MLLFHGVMAHYENAELPPKLDNTVSNLTAPPLVRSIVPSSQGGKTNQWMRRWLHVSLFGFRPILDIPPPRVPVLWFAGVAGLQDPEKANLLLTTDEHNPTREESHRLTSRFLEILDHPASYLCLHESHKAHDTLSIGDLNFITFSICRIRRPYMIRVVLRKIAEFLELYDASESEDHSTIVSQCTEWYRVIRNAVNVCEGVVTLLGEKSIGHVHQSNLTLLCKLSPLDFWGIFFGPVCEEVEELTPYNPNAWWKDYYFPGSIGILDNPVMVGRREEIVNLLRQPKLIKNPKTAGELTFKYLEMLLKGFVEEPLAPLLDFDYFVYTNGVVPANLEISHADYRAQVENLTLGTRNVGFVKSYSNLNWFNFAKETEKKANLVILDPPYIQTYPDTASAQNNLNTLAAINRGLDSELELLTKENLCSRVLESALEASQVDAIFLIWCSLEQSVEYLNLYKVGTLRERGLTGLTVCTINGKFSQAGSNQNQQIPVNQSEFFIVAKKGTPRQSTFIPWAPEDPDAVEPISQSSHFSTRSKYWNQDAFYPHYSRSYD